MLHHAVLVVHVVRVFLLLFVVVVVVFLFYDASCEKKKTFKTPTKRWNLKCLSLLLIVIVAIVNMNTLCCLFVASWLRLLFAVLACVLVGLADCDWTSQKRIVFSMAGRKSNTQSQNLMNFGTKVKKFLFEERKRNNEAEQTTNYSGAIWEAGYAFFMDDDLFIKCSFFILFLFLLRIDESNMSRIIQQLTFINQTEQFLLFLPTPNTQCPVCGGAVKRKALLHEKL